MTWTIKTDKGESFALHTTLLVPDDITRAQVQVELEVQHAELLALFPQVKGNPDDVLLAAAEVIGLVG